MTDAVAQLLPLFPAVPLIAAAFALLAPWRAVRDSIMLIIPVSYTHLTLPTNREV